MDAAPGHDASRVSSHDGQRVDADVHGRLEALAAGLARTGISSRRSGRMRSNGARSRARRRSAFARSNTRATSSSFWTSHDVISLAPIGSASLRTRRSILSPGRWVKPSSAPSARSFCAIAQAMLKSFATPRIIPFLPENSPIPGPFRLYVHQKLVWLIRAWTSAL